MKVKNSVALPVIAIFAIVAATIAGYALVKLEDNDAEMIESIREQQRSTANRESQKSLAAPMKSTVDLESALNLEALDEQDFLSEGDSEEIFEAGLADEFGQSFVENEF